MGIRSLSIRPRAAAVAILALATACSQPKGPPHVIVISLDTTRADHLSCYGGGASKTPAIDELASQGALFADVTAPAPTTLASHTSLMTGTYPHTHGVVRNGFDVNADNVMLAEILRDAGYHTAGFLGSFALESRFDFDQGFAYFDEQFDLLVDRERDQNQRVAERVTDAVLAHVDEVEGEPLFLFAHYFDAHVPYAPPAPWDSRYTPDGKPSTSTQRDVNEAAKAHQHELIGQAPGLAGVINYGLRPPLIRRATGQPLGDDLRLAGLYAGEVSYMDASIGRLLAGLDDRGILEDAIVVVTGDHGETFWEHGDFWNHGLWLYQTTVAVPLILRLPDGRFAGERVEQPVSTIDLVPTICELLALPIPARVEGVSLMPALMGEPFDRGPVYSEATQPGYRFEEPGKWGNLKKARCVRVGRHKYIWCPYLKIGQLFDLEDDPLEQRNLLGPPPLAPEIAATRDELRSLLGLWTKAARPLPSAYDSTQIDETMKRLQAMGYSGDDDEDEGESPGSDGDGGR